GEYVRFRSDPKLPVTGPGVSKDPYFDRLLMRVGYERRRTLGILTHYNFVRGGTPLMPRRTLERVGTFDETLAIHGDYEMWLRIVSHYQIRFMNEIVYYYRLHAGSTQAHASAALTARCARMICERYGIGNSLQFAGIER